MPSCWVEVNLDAIRHNYRAIKNVVGDETSIIAVVKANAYGHGAVEVSRALSAEGVSYLAVTRLDEALSLRAAGLLTPILLLTPALPDEVDEVVAQNLTACLSGYEDAERLSQAAAKRNVTARAHLKINTGMGRLGVEPDEAIEIATRIAQLPHLSLDAAFTHFAFAAEPDPQKTHLQFARFAPLVQRIANATGIKPTAFHCANSAATLRFPSMRLSCIRPGTILYGQYPSAMAKESAEQQHLELRDGFAVKARVLTIRDIQQGQSVGYGGEWKAAKPTRIATIAIGWADGLTMEPNPRTPQPKAEIQKALRALLKRSASTRTVAIRDERAPIVGRIAMQQCSIDISHIEGIQIGDAATVAMRRTSAGAHLPRVYVGD
ncbi:MAG TPA: alanine racemase [Abditibacteriaceae bacterium]|jgi:alanine racemase